MVQIIIGCFAFLLFFLGDYNDWRLSNPVLKLCFPVGLIMLAAATAVGIFAGEGIKRILLIIPSVVFLALLVYTLFFAIPVNQSYISQHNGRSVCNTGQYALCRHPGVLYFFGLYICLYFMGIVSLAALVIFCALDLLLVIFEDVLVFPDVLEGYEQYKKEVPFLIPGTGKLFAGK